MTFLNLKFLIKTLAIGIVWALTFYWVRKALNKSNFGELRKASTEKLLLGEAQRSNFFNDAMYGGIAASVAFISNKVIDVAMEKYY
jgi:hypothetical protein